MNVFPLPESVIAERHPSELSWAIKTSGTRKTTYLRHNGTTTTALSQAKVMPYAEARRIRSALSEYGNYARLVPVQAQTR